jgi:hypothetical protein
VVFLVGGVDIAIGPTGEVVLAGNSGIAGSKPGFSSGCPSMPGISRSLVFSLI